MPETLLSPWDICRTLFTKSILCCFLKIDTKEPSYLESHHFIEKRKATLELEKLGKQYRKETVK